MGEIRRMDIVTEKVRFQTLRGCELINVTDKVREIVKRSGVREGTVNVYSSHTTAAVLINENEPGLEEDIPDFIQRLVPEEGPYRHHHFLPSDGRNAVNAWAHLRNCLLGSHVSMPIVDGDLLKGRRQNVYLVELDGPKIRSFVVQVFGIK